MNKTKFRKTNILKYGLFAPLALLAILLSSTKISECKMYSTLSENAKPTNELSKTLLINYSSFLKESKTIETRYNKIQHQTKPCLIESDSVDEQANDKSNNSAVYGFYVPHYSSTDTTDKIKAIEDVEVLPTFPGGVNAFGKFMSENLKYPDKARQEKIQGKVFCEFVIEKDGSLSKLKIIKGIGGGCDEETIRVLLLSPKWQPGIQNGKPVRVSYSLPITFRADFSVHPRPHSSLAEIFADNKRLLIIDSAEYKGDRSKLNDVIKPSDIEKIYFTDGESATMKYGNEGKDGVTEIFTKKK